MVQTRLENGNEPGSKMERTKLENGTIQARTRHELGSKMAQTRLENGTNQARKKHEPSSKPALKIIQFVSFRLEAGHAKRLELRHDRRIDVTQMTSNSVRKAKTVMFIILNHQVRAAINVCQLCQYFLFLDSSQPPLNETPF